MKLPWIWCFQHPELKNQKFPSSAASAPLLPSACLLTLHLRSHTANKMFLTATCGGWRELCMCVREGGSQREREGGSVFQARQINEPVCQFAAERLNPPESSTEVRLITPSQLGHGCQTFLTRLMGEWLKVRGLCHMNIQTDSQTFRLDKSLWKAVPFVIYWNIFPIN